MFAFALVCIFVHMPAQESTLLTFFALLSWVFLLGVSTFPLYQCVSGLDSSSDRPLWATFG